MSISDCKDVANHGVPLQLCNRFKKSEQPSHEDVVDFLQQHRRIQSNKEHLEFEVLGHAAME